MIAFHFSFDLDQVLCCSFGENPLFFSEKGAVVKAAGHYWLVFPGVKELLRTLIKLPQANLSFYSAGTDQRNREFVDDLMTQTLGEEWYGRVKDRIQVLSRSDLVEGKKDLTKVKAPLSKIIHIDDDQTRWIKSQKSQWLITYPVTNSTYELAQDTNRISFIINQISYIAGVISKLLTEQQGYNTQEALRRIHPCPYPQRQDSSLYRLGESLLQQENPAFQLMTKQMYRETKLSIPRPLPQKQQRSHLQRLTAFFHSVTLGRDK